MDRMRPRTRLLWCAVLIVGSAGYAVLIAKDRGLAQTIMLGYIGLVLTIFAVNHLWRKPDE